MAHRTSADGGRADGGRADGAAHTRTGPGDDGTDPPAEYRTAELARAAGITVRTLRFYRERRLLPPPRREGRIAWYNEHHLNRLRTISALLARGHTLGGIADLIDAFEKGRDAGGAAELLGLESTLVSPWSQETPVRLTPEDLAAHFPDEVTSDNLATALDLGYVAVDGDEVVHVSRRLLDASTSLVGEGIPLGSVLEAGRVVREHADAVADLFTGLVRAHLFTGVRELSPDDLRRLSDVMDRLRPLAEQVVNVELALAMDRRVRAELESWSRPDGPGGNPEPEPDPGPGPGPGPGPDGRPRDRPGG
ncbi:MerR family transcriptional regulator [Streptomyces verrucosisporus]|uniref:MerR family transcriptional regulator n=1 Tax=Streptomyces verrucosisporus TaxID=1695161 RepID=UPI0019D2BF9F|nr:MerR family transcriptional regulator [Streptomyces verrucosisporus]MBN3928991.1 MerR family transcriptional regulator [Streptomyces verrucosisporus]